jgi:hypothetical protein
MRHGMQLPTRNDKDGKIQPNPQPSMSCQYFAQQCSPYRIVFIEFVANFRKKRVKLLKVF